MNGPDTTKIIVDYTTELERAEKELKQNFSFPKLKEVQWLRRKVGFYQSDHYPQYKQDNQVQR